MSKLSHPTAFAAVLICLLFVASPDLRAQERAAPKMEVGAHFTTLELADPVGFLGNRTITQPGLGGRFAYNANDHLGLEGEINLMPQRGYFGRTVQGQFGVKAGKRFRRFGLFAKARPGFVSFSEVFSFTGRTFTFTGFDGTIIVSPEIGLERRTHLSVDVGGVFEFYPSRKLLVRVDAGDTMINHRREEAPPGVSAFESLPGNLTHNFQLSAGVAYRFREPAGADESDPPAPEGGTPRFEAGVQYTALVLNQPTEIVNPPVIGSGVEPATEPAVGGRLTFNVSDHFAVEGAVDLFTREQFTGPTYGGKGVQGQFGVKAGRRFRRFGLFAKARPGFLSYGEVFRREGTETIIANGQTFTFDRFGAGRKTYFEIDLGGVLEFYPARRFVTRFDFGDTIIRYRGRDRRGSSLRPGSNRQPDETRHNFQFGAGFGVRF